MTFTNALTLLFIGLKLANYIDWSWWLVLSPSILSFVLLLVVSTLEAVEEDRKVRRGK